MKPEGLLVTGVYGTGKSSVIEELSERLERSRLSYCAIDLDLLMWFDSGIDDAAHERVFLSNLTVVIDNYTKAGAERFLLAGFVKDQSSLAALREAVPFSLKVIQLQVPIEQIEQRLSADITVGRKNNLHATKLASQSFFDPDVARFGFLVDHQCLRSRRSVGRRERLQCGAASQQRLRRFQHLFGGRGLKVFGSGGRNVSPS